MGSYFFSGDDRILGTNRKTTQCLMFYFFFISIFRRSDQKLAGSETCCENVVENRKALLFLSQLLQVSPFVTQLLLNCNHILAYRIHKNVYRAHL